MRAAHPTVRVVDDSDDLVRTDLDVYAPCTLGGALSAEVADLLQARSCAAPPTTNSSTTRSTTSWRDGASRTARTTWSTQAGCSRSPTSTAGFSASRAEAAAARIYDTTLAVLEAAVDDGVTPAEAADAIAVRRIASVTGPARIWVPT